MNSFYRLELASKMGNRNGKELVINDQYFKSASEASRILGISVQTVLRRVRNEQYPNYRFYETDSNEE